MKRLGKVHQEMERRNLVSFIVSNEFNVRYLSGFTGDTGWLLVNREGADLVTDFRYEEQATQEAYPGVKVVIDKRDVLAATCDRLAKVEGRIDYVKLVSVAAKLAGAFLGGSGSPKPGG